MLCYTRLRAGSGYGYGGWVKQTRFYMRVYIKKMVSNPLLLYLQQNFMKIFKENVRKDAEILKNNEDVAKEVNQLVFTPED